MDERTRADLQQLRGQLIGNLEADGLEYEKVEIVEGGLEIHTKDGRVIPVMIESEVERLQRILDEDIQRQREREQMPATFSLINSPMLGWAAAAAQATQAKTWGGGGKYSSVHGDVKREKARAKRKRLKKHKKRGR